MRKPLIAVTLLAIAIFGVGYVAGQVLGISPTSAATSTTPTPTTTQPGIGSGFHGMQGDTPHADGTVTAISGNTVTIKADADSGSPNEYTNVTTVQLTNSTQYDAGRDDSGTTAGKSSITVG